MSTQGIPSLAGAEKVQSKTVEIPTRDPSVFFKPVKEIEVVKALKVSGWGEIESGKSYFAQTFPEPIYIIDTELAAASLAFEHFPDKDIRIMEVKIVDPDTDEPRPLECLKEMEAAIRSLKNVNEGTVVIDTITDFWSWMHVWVESTAEIRYKKTGKAMRVEWGKANERYKYFVMRLIAKKSLNVVLLGQDKKKYSSKGDETGTTEPRWMWNTPNWSYVNIHFFKVKTEIPMEYKATLTKCRWNRAYNKTVDDLTYDKLLKILRVDLKVKVLQ